MRAFPIPRLSHIRDSRERLSNNAGRVLCQLGVRLSECERSIFFCYRHVENGIVREVDGRAVRDAGRVGERRPVHGRKQGAVAWRADAPATQQTHTTWSFSRQLQKRQFPDDSVTPQKRKMEMEKHPQGSQQLTTRGN